MVFSIFRKQSKKAFTLVELMIVIAILGILIVAISQFNADFRISQERVMNFANIISDMHRDIRHDSMVGRMHNGKFVNKGYTFEISKSFVVTKRKGEDITKGGEDIVLQYTTPFFNGDKNYKIEKIETCKDYKYADCDNKDSLIINYQGISESPTVFDWETEAADIKTYIITLDYKWFKRYIYGNIYSGAIDILNPGAHDERTSSSTNQNNTP